MNTIKTTDNTSKEYLNEIINILIQIRKLQSKPHAQLKPIYQFCRIMMLIGTPFLILFLTFGIKDRNTVFMMLSTILAVCLLTIGSALLSMRKLRNHMTINAGESILIIDTDWVESQSSNGQTTRLAWNQIAYIRVFEHSVCFIPRSLTGFLINIDKSYADEIIQAIQAEAPDTNVIR
ncbi:MAG TPA: hypothetical protein GX736_05300 [Mogibacterium sp.]|nr:hypothetical protein [Mogibacterium sp.]